MKSSVGHIQGEVTTATNGWPLSVKLQVANQRAFPVAVNSVSAGAVGVVQSWRL